MYELLRVIESADALISVRNEIMDKEIMPTHQFFFFKVNLLRGPKFRAVFFSIHDGCRVQKSFPCLAMGSNSEGTCCWSHGTR